MNIANQSAIERDFKMLSAPPPSASDLILTAAVDSGINPFKSFLDYLKLKRGVGQLRFDEYICYGLHVVNNWEEGERERFLSSDIHWSLYEEICSREWLSITEDKWISGILLQSANVPTPRTIAVIDRSKRLFPGALKLDSSDSLRDFCNSTHAFPVFAKSMGGICSAGAFVLEGGDSTHVLVKNEAPMTYDEFLSSFIKPSESYVIQESVQPHDFFNGITTATPTVRLINLINDSGVFTPYALLKLPLGNNVADNFWREGNIVCSLDMETGQIKTLVSKKENVLTQHGFIPSTDRVLLGETFPMWEEVKVLNEKVALLHSQIVFNSTDIALSNEGPIVIEVNAGSAVELPQIATGKGFLTDEIREFFMASGSKILQ